MTTREYRNYKRMSKMTVRFLEKEESKNDENPVTTKTAISMPIDKTASELQSLAKEKENKPSISFQDLTPIKKSPSPGLAIAVTKTDNNLAKSEEILQLKSRIVKSENGRYINWNSKHTALVAQPWCCIGDLITFCDKHEYRSINRSDPQLHNRIVTQVKTLLSGQAPFDIRKRFPSDTHSPENLWVCIGRCVGVEYHLNRILSVFRRPLDKLSADKQRMVRQDFHLAVNELRLDISARISEVRLYDRQIFERDFHLEWQEDPVKD